MTERELVAPPFNLDVAGLAWVKSTIARLTPDQRLAQLFVLRSGVDKEAFERIKSFEPGGITAVRLRSMRFSEHRSAPRTAGLLRGDRL